MKRFPLAIITAVSVLVLAAACGDDDDGGNGVSGSTEPGPDFLVADIEALVQTQIGYINQALAEGDPEALTGDELEQALIGMVLQAGDIPEGLQSLGGSFSDNEQASGGLGGGPTKEQLDEWGRILGYQVDYQRTAPPTGANITAVNSSISLYRAPNGAADSLADRVDAARNVDWQIAYPELEEFDLRELTPDLPVDDLFWLRISGFQQTAPDTRAFVTDDQIVFRIENAWGFVRAISSGPED